MRTARAVLATLTAVTLTACTTAVPGSPGLATRADNLLGDFRTIDACSLVDTSAFDDFGGAQRGYNSGFDTCDIYVGMSQGEADATVMVGELIEVGPWTDDTYKPLRNLPGGMWVKEWDSTKDPEYRGESDDAQCDQLLGFTDGIALLATALAFERPEGSTMCDLADVAIREALKVIRAGGVEHRGYPERSLGRLDACELVPGNPLAGTALYSRVKRSRNPAGHECFWFPDDVMKGSAGRLVLLELTVGFPVENDTDEPRTIGGRRSVISKSSDDDRSICEIRTEHTRSEGDEGVTESARVYAHGPAGKVDEVCDGALAVAEAAWPKLPAK